jgi:putative endonuclease
MPDPRIEERSVPRSNTHVLGSAAEIAAASLLLRHGYHVVERNFRTKAGEIDIVAYRAHPRFARSPRHVRANHPLARYARMLCFVEVRSRADEEHGGALLAIGYRKRKQVTRVAGHYLAIREPDYEEIRFDVVGITAGDAVLIEDAFRAER